MTNTPQMTIQEKNKPSDQGFAITDTKPRWYALHHDDGKLFDVVFACNGSHAQKYYDHECGTGLPFPGYVEPGPLGRIHSCCYCGRRHVIQHVGKY